jgi:hypothetical protein
MTENTTSLPVEGAVNSTHTYKPNPNGANQYQLDPRQLKCWEYYVDPKSETFGNAYQSALKAGYEEATAAQITSFDWFVEKRRRLNLLSKSEKVLEETLETPHIVPLISMFGPVIDKETNQPYQKVEPSILKIKQDTAKFIASTQGKNEGYSQRTEVTGPNGKELPTPILANVFSNNSTEENSKVIEADSSDTRGNISIEDNINTPAIDSPSPERQEANTDISSI